MTSEIRTSAELRTMFGANLRQLAARYSSISELCRQLGINRTQFNRYLAGESFPRPNVLDRICRFFHVDARILLKPLDEIPSPKCHNLPDAVAQFLRPDLVALTENLFPSGFYHAIELTPNTQPQGRHWLFHAQRLHHCAILRAFLPLAETSDPSPRARELRGFAACAGDNIYALLSHHNAQGSRMLLFRKASTRSKNVWTGQCTDMSRTNQQKCDLEIRGLGNDLGAALKVARLARCDWKTTHFKKSDVSL